MLQYLVRGPLAQAAQKDPCVLDSGHQLTLPGPARGDIVLFFSTRGSSAVGLPNIFQSVRVTFSGVSLAVAPLRMNVESCVAGWALPGPSALLIRGSESLGLSPLALVPVELPAPSGHLHQVVLCT